jgi:hypothetical protein
MGAGGNFTFNSLFHFGRYNIAAFLVAILHEMFLIRYTCVEVFSP